MSRATAPMHVLWLILCLTGTARAGADPHLVGWVNTAVPGAGQLLLGDPLLAGAQATGEVGTFLWGYSWSAQDPRGPMTLDGVPERIPLRGPEGSPRVDLSRQLYADMLQEAGLKFHMVNVYNAYREAGAPGTDPSTTLELFEAPFKGEYLSSPWVWGALGVTAAAVVADYYVIAKRGVTPLAQLTGGSNALYGATYGVVYPVGSAAPEEMFYRGFLQGELQSLVPSPVFSIGLSTAAFTFSHQSGDRPTAAIAGAYLGFLAHHFGGRLGPGIAYHFWSDVLSGALAFALLQKAQYAADAIPPLTVRFSF